MQAAQNVTSNGKLFDHLVPLPYPDPHGSTLEENRLPLPGELSIECTTDMQYLSQYFFIRQHAYRNDLKVKTFSGEEDEIDRRSHLLVARKGHFCIGGARLTVSTVEKPAKLPVERGDFNVQNYLPFLKDANYCEIGRTAVLPEYRNSSALHQLFQLGIDIAHEHGCKYVVGASPPAVARHFRRTFAHLGYRDELHPDIPAPMGPENQHLNLVFQILYI